MAINASNLKWFLTGGSTNTNPLTSLGGVVSSLTVDPTTLFDTVTGDQAAAGTVEYRVIALKNEDATTGGWQDVRLWIDANTSGGDDVRMFAPASGSKNLTFTAGAAESNSPSGLGLTNSTMFVSTNTSKANGFVLGTLTQNEYICIAIMRSVPSSCAATATSSFQIKAEGDSNA
jgi:hypothetical protein